MMCNKNIGITTHSKTYEIVYNKDVNGGASDYPSSPTTPPLSGPLHLGNHIFDLVLRPPKSIIHKSIFNPSECAAKKYNIVEYFSQEPCAMSTLEVLQNFPSQCKTLFSTIGALDPSTSNLISFNLE